MFVRSTRLNSLLSLFFIISMGACGNLGSCSCASAPLPGGKLPADQTVEGGAQVRVTKSGFDKLTAILPGLINTGFGTGFCVGKGTVIGFVDYCGNTDGMCNPGCKITPHLNSLTVNVNPNQQTLNIVIDASGGTNVPLDAGFLGSCTLSASVDHLIANIDITLGIDPTTGELTIHANNINQFSFNGTHFSGGGACGFIGDVASVVVDIFNSAIGQFVIQLLTPVIDNLIQGFLPHPLGIAGMLDVGKMLQGVSPGTEALMEGRIVPGGYVQLNNSGMSLGVITGLNADEDPTTRVATRDPLNSEPSRCVPPIAAPDFSAPPANLPITTRNTFGLAPANQFNGAPDPAADLAMGISETTLDLAGHHMVTSGALCLGVGTSLIAQLNVGTVGLLVPSLADLQSDHGNDPLLLVTRPQRALDFTIGENTTASPALTIKVDHMEVDFYAFLYERYVRAFTLDLSMNIGVNLTFEQMAGMPASIKPTLVGISSQSVTVKVLNSEFVKETADHLAMVLPSVFDLVTPLLGNIPAIPVPTFAGFSLNNLSIQHVTTTQDDFLALFASLGTSAPFRALALHDPYAADAARTIDADIAAPQPQSKGRARLVNVYTPSAEKIRAALVASTTTDLPSITFEVDHTDASGRELEWTWNINGGLFRDYSSATPLVISDRAFAWQGKYTIGLKSRVKGDYHTVSDLIETPVVIDSVGPRIFTEKLELDGDNNLSIPLWDIVSGKTVQYGFGKPGDDAPVAWIAGGTARLAKADFDKLMMENQVTVFAKDEQGNVAQVLLAPFHGTAGAAGCACNTEGGPSSGGLILIGIVGLAFANRRSWKARMRRFARHHSFVTTLIVWAGASVAMSLQPGCSCGNHGEKTCEMAADCGADFCMEGQLPQCIDNTCLCSDDIVPGRIGPYSHLAVGGDGSIWVSAYAQSYGDLVVAKVVPGRVPDTAWEWVDGVPADGAVVAPGSAFRGGVMESGPDVGMYTSIAVNAQGVPMVTYFDRDNASLKFAAKVNGAWQIHVVDMGTGMLGETGALVGMYSSITLRTDDGRPGVAYLAHVADAAMGQRAEVRYAAAQVAVPQSAADWQFWTVDTAPVPASTTNIYPLPEGLGLFIDSARLPNQAPVVVYYDRANGELKLAKFDPSIGQFSTPKVLEGGTGNDSGWSPTVAVGQDGTVNVAYVNAQHDDLKFITDKAGAPAEVIDDGYRIVGQSVDGLPKPTYDFVGDDATIVLPPGGTPLVAYQDSTTQELLLAGKQGDGSWTHVSVAGHTTPWPGAYGFFASGAISGTNVVMSSWVIDQPSGENWVEVFARATVIQ